MSPSLTKAERAMLGRRALQPVKGPDELLAVFVPGKLVNTKNARLHWAAESRYKRGWRERVATALMELGWLMDLNLLNVPVGGRLPGAAFVKAAYPKEITFLGRVHARMDSDGLQVACAPIRDALIDCGVIAGDADKDGHRFEYGQQIDRKNRGVTIRVRLAPSA